MRKIIFILLSFGLTAALAAQAPSQPETDQADADASSGRDQIADQILTGVINKLSQAKSLVFDAGVGGIEGEFRGGIQVTLLRPGNVLIERLSGSKKQFRKTEMVADGKGVWRIHDSDFVAYHQPWREENFYYETNPIVQYFFHPVIEFDPRDPTWGKSVSLFDTNKEAYNRHVTTKYLGEQQLYNVKAKVVEVKFNSAAQLIRQRFYIVNSEIVCLQHTFVHPYFHTEISRLVSFANYRYNEPVDEKRFAYTAHPNLPLVETDPVRLGEVAPDFQLPLNTGGEIKLKDVLKNKKAVLIVALAGVSARARCKTPDYFLPQMKLMQEIRDKFEKQGLEVIAVVGGSGITPKVKEEMLADWLPDQARFSYPIAMDLDLEKGIQGSAYENFQVDGRNNVLLDKDGRVVFACEEFSHDALNELALYQALAQIGFAVSPADLERKGGE